MPDDVTDSIAIAVEQVDRGAQVFTPVAQNSPSSAVIEVPLPGSSTIAPSLKVGELDERGNTVKYIYAWDQDYVVYYSRLEDHDVSDEHTVRSGAWWVRAARLGHLGRKKGGEPRYESEGVQAQLSMDPAKRSELRKVLLPLGTERAKLQALLRGWPRRQSYDASIATALQLALDGGHDAEAREIALQTLRDAKASILNEREIAGRAQYVRFTFGLAIVALVILKFAETVLFHGSGYFWLGAQAGILGALLSIAIGIRRRTVDLDIGIAGNLSDSALRLVIGAVSGGTLVLLFSTGILPSLHTLKGEQDGVASLAFALLLGIIAGFVEQLVPSLLENQGQSMGGRDHSAGDAAKTGG